MRHYRSPKRDQIADVFGHSEQARGMQVDDLLACGSRVRVWQPSSRVHARLSARKKTQPDRSGLLLQPTTWRVRSDTCVDAGAVEPFCNLRTDFTETVNDSAADAAPAPVMTAAFRSKSLLTRYSVSAG